MWGELNYNFTCHSKDALFVMISEKVTIYV